MNSVKTLNHCVVAQERDTYLAGVAARLPAST